jgi:hypothetical protein
VVGARQRAQRAQERRIGEFAFALLNRLAAQHHSCGTSVVAVGCAAGELRYKSGLADARLAAQQDDSGFSLVGLMQRELQFGHLPDAAHEVGCGESRAHDRSIP